MKSNNEVTAQVVRELLTYDAATGELRWTKSKGAAPGGSIAGTKHYKGYTNICLFGKRYGAHRVVWMHIHGEWPQGEVDHVDGDKTNNRIENLRDVDHEANTQNLKQAHKRNKLGFLGVSKPKGCRFFIARIYVSGRPIQIGRFEFAEEAHAAYLAAKREMHSGCTI